MQPRGSLVSVPQQFFSIEHAFLINYQALASDATLPNAVEFDAMIPAPFKLASHINNIEAQALRPLRSLSENAHDLAEFLNLQSKKIDLMMNYILTLGADNQQRLLGTHFGGSNVVFLNTQPTDVDRLIKLRIFIEDNNCAIFCIAKIIECDHVEDHFVTNVEIVMIGDEDQEQLVRTSLHVQSSQLKARAELRKDKGA